ncbi:MAG: hypothetical protein IT495_17120 [Gammaproteobacteria bacterium]|nr:hypothetical protein [Gammaproteobacteria bacterium]
MARAVTRYVCPHCRRPVELEALRDDRDWREFVALCQTLPAVVQRPLDEYLQLFRPALRELAPGRMRRLTQQIAPMIHAARVRRAGTDYVVPAEHWAAGMLYLVDTPPATLKLPLKSHGYLLEVLAARAERAAATAEQRVEDGRRHSDRAAGGPAPVGELLSRLRDGADGR